MTSGAPQCTPVVQVAHRLPGRVRFRVHTDDPQHLTKLVHTLRHPGIRAVQPNPLTGSVLIFYDPQSTNEEALRQAIREALRQPATSAPRHLPHSRSKSRVSVHHRTTRIDSQGRHWQRVRLHVTGLEDNHTLAREIESKLQELGIRFVRASV
ncbi:MAG: HMA2 domain-containing protein, partial [Thermomicrobium sp.]